MDLEIETIVHVGPHVLSPDRQVRQRRESVELRHAVADSLESIELPPDLGPNLLEQPALEREDLLFRARHPLLPLLELGREVALGVRERLLAHVVLRDPVEVGLRHLEVVTEHLVVADLQGGDSRARPLASLERRDEVSRTVPGRPQLVELG